MQPFHYINELFQNNTHLFFLNIKTQNIRKEVSATVKKNLAFKIPASMSPQHCNRKIHIQ